LIFAGIISLPLATSHLKKEVYEKRMA